MSDDITIKGTKYIPYSLEWKNLGGRFSKREAVEILKANGIKVISSPSRCYTPYVGHYALLVEKKFEKKADKLLFR